MAYPRRTKFCIYKKTFNFHSLDAICTIFIVSAGRENDSYAIVPVGGDKISGAYAFYCGMLELNEQINLENSIVYKEFYKNSYIGHLGIEVLDFTIAIKKGEDISIPAYQTVNRKSNWIIFKRLRE